MPAFPISHYQLTTVLGQVDPVTPSQDFPCADLLGNLSSGTAVTPRLRTPMAQRPDQHNRHVRR